MTLPNPLDNPDLFDSIVLAGVQSPGKVTLSGHDRKVTWDVKSGPGLQGATTTIKEIPPIEFTASFYLVKDDAQGIDDFAAWEPFLAVVNSSLSGTKPKALEIYHPDLALNEITSVCKAQVGGAVHDGKGGITYVIKFQEYKPPKPKGGSPSGTKTSTKKKDDPDAAALAQLAALTDQYKQTPWG
jgi:hypothetical protein